MTLISKPTPMSTEVRSGLSDLRRRIGEHGAFKASMLRGLRSRHRPGLSDIQTLSDEDWTVAFIDAWAGVLDNLSFYNERIANESYLGTATETFSVQELAALVGYTLSPPMAAETHLAFTADTSVLDAGVSELAPPLAVKSIPEEGEQPQHFETIEPLRLKGAWNDIRVLSSWPQTLTLDDTGFYASTSTPRPAPGAPLVFVNEVGTPMMLSSDPRRFLHRVAGTTRINANREWVSLVAGSSVGPLPSLASASLPDAAVTADLMRPDLAAFQVALTTHRWQRSTVLEGLKHLSLSAAEVATSLANTSRIAETLSPIVFRETCRVFGHNAVTDRADGAIDPAPSVLRSAHAALVEGAADEAPADNMLTIFLDRKYPAITGGSLLMIRSRLKFDRKIYEGWVRVEEVDTASIEAFGQSGEVTRLRVPRWWNGLAISDFLLRDTTIYAAPDPVMMPDLAIQDDVQGNTLMLDVPDFDLAPGHVLILSGQRADLAGVRVSERITVAEVRLNATTLHLTLASPLAHVYRRDTVTLNGNVARATHGESVSEVLGSGDARVRFQSFRLRGGPLTYVSAQSPSGRSAQLELLVDGVRWQETSALDQAEPNDRVYSITTREDGSSEIKGGDGVNGARFPTGENNIVAHFRKGAGVAGRLRANQLSLLASKPRSLTAVTNPLASTGGGTGETIENARKNTPLKMLTNGRIVSLRDYEDFARGFAGVSKARAAWSWIGENQSVFLSVAGETEAPMPLDTGILPNLNTAILANAAPGTQLKLRPARLAYFTLSARLLIDPNYVAADGSVDPVFTSARRALRDTYAYAKRGMGLAVRASDVILLLQQVAGVSAVDLDLLHRLDQTQSNQTILRADVPRTGVQGDMLGHEILLLSSDPVKLEQI